MKGTDGKYHVACELAVLKCAPRGTTLIKVAALTGNAARRVSTTLQGDELVTRTLRVGSYPREPSPVTSIPAGQTALLLRDDVHDNRGAIPPTVTHRVEASFALPAADQQEVAGVYPDRHIGDDGDHGGVRREHRQLSHRSYSMKRRQRPAAWDAEHAR